MCRLGQGRVDGAERVADLGTEQAHNSDYNDGHKRDNNRVLDEALTFFFRCKQHGNIPFFNKLYPRNTLRTVHSIAAF